MHFPLYSFVQNFVYSRNSLIRQSTEFLKNQIYFKVDQMTTRTGATYKPNIPVDCSKTATSIPQSTNTTPTKRKLQLTLELCLRLKQVTLENRRTQMTGFRFSADQNLHLDEAKAQIRN
eukprot:GHVP01065039.1.p1 GENE.GHVP01065039.1~~GHVP01065039.1.p1  ORF type:complete len:119 (+),score=14.51 GHVP01065039.1:1108-1464(+)